jgi:methionyl-tRNA formyltransferase
VKYRGVDSAKRVAVVGCKHTTQELILGLEHQGFTIDHSITLSPEKGEEQRVAGYLDLRPFLAERGIPHTLVRKYGMNGGEDQRTLAGLKLDMLLVMGWQRLIPAWFLESLSIGAFGMHGSSRPLPYGRGRSPMNWSLIQNRDRFYTYLFRYRPGVDDGEIVSTQLFDITPFDTCLTLHYKNLLAMIQLLSASLPSLLAGTATFTPQPAEGASYYPMRSEDDGLIYWTDPVLQIYNLIRAVTKPFPGAFSYLDDNPAKKVFIWRAIPFDTQLVWPTAKPGEIVAVFANEDFVVKTADATLLVQECEGAKLVHADTGRRFGDLATPRKVWKDLPN